MLLSNVVKTFGHGRFRKSYDNVKLINSRLRQNRYNQIISQIAIEKDVLRNAFKEKFSGCLFRGSNKKKKYLCKLDIISVNA